MRDREPSLEVQTGRWTSLAGRMGLARIMFKGYPLVIFLFFCSFYVEYSFSNM